jgi:hypothetical protein
MQTESVADRLMASKLGFSKWDGIAALPQVARDAEETAKARRGSARAEAKVFDCAELRAVLTEMGAMYNWWRATTAPWRDGGWRVMLGAYALEFLEEARVRTEKIERELLPALVRVYPVRLEEMRLSAGTFFDQANYPDPSEVQDRFAVRLSVEAVPSAHMLQRFGQVFSQAQLDSAREQEQEQIAAAMKDVWVKLFTPVKHMLDTLDKEDATAGGVKRWHESLVGNIAEAAQAARALNFNGDPELDKIAQDMQDHLAVLKTGALKEDVAVRSAAKARARDMVKRMAGYIG